MRPPHMTGGRMLAALAAIVFAVLLNAHAAGAAEAPVVVLKLEGAVTPASADYVVRGLRKAADRGATLVVLQMDTPGGLDTSMRWIIKEILASPVPVAAYVAPSGARAASAGTFILYASHIAAMAPATNLGAATPVAIGGAPQGEPEKERKPRSKTAKKSDNDAADDEPDPKGAMTRKQVNDAAAYIRSLAHLRGRNADWGEQAVREAVSLPAQEARKRKVVDLVATDVADLLKQLHGRKLAVQGVERTLATRGATVTVLEPDWRSRLLVVITDPSIALILMMIGIYGLIAYSVQQRNQEIGIRLALGATPGQVKQMVVVEGLRLVVVGLVVGLAAAAAFGKVLATLLYGVTPWDPTTLIGAPLVLGAIALVATWLPARRASRVDPIEALRYE